MSIITKDVAAGVTFMALGLAGVVIARGYDMGTARTMGPGYFPAILSTCMLLLGGAIFLQGIISKSREAAEPIHWRPVGMITLGILLFSLLVERAGLVISVAVLIAIGSYAGREARWREVLILGAGMIVFCGLVFVYGVKLPISLFPG